MTSDDLEAITRARAQQSAARLRIVGMAVSEQTLVATWLQALRRVLDPFLDTVCMLLRKALPNSREIPRAISLPFVGTTLSFMASGGPTKLHLYIDKRHKQLGSILVERLSSQVDMVFLSDAREFPRVFASEGRYPRHVLPEAWLLYNEMHDCKRGLFFMDGEEWKHYRRLLNPLLLKSNGGVDFYSCGSYSAERLIDQWKQFDSGDIRGLERHLYRWSTETITYFLLGPQYSTHCEKLQPILDTLSETVHLVFKESGKLNNMPVETAAKLGLGAWKNFETAVERAYAAGRLLVLDIIAMHQDEEGLVGKLLASGLDNDMVVRLVTDLVLAAGDTTAYTLEWALYLLCTHPEIQDQLYREICAADDNQKILNLPLLKGIIKETLRLYPVATFITRFLEQETELCGYKVPANQLVILSLYTSGRDASYFPHPEEFWPGRWTLKEDGSFEGVSVPSAYVPFAHGKRSCIGRVLAETQLKLAIATIVRCFRLEMLNAKPVEIVMRMVAVPSEEIRLKLTERLRD